MHNDFETDSQDNRTSLVDTRCTIFRNRLLYTHVVDLFFVKTVFKSFFSIAQVTIFAHFQRVVLGDDTFKVISPVCSALL